MKSLPTPKIIAPANTHVVLPTTTEEHKKLRDFIIRSEDSYPGIEAWFDRKVKADLKTGARVGLLLEIDNQFKGAALFKLSEDAKLCSLRLEPGVEGQGYGQFFWDATIEIMRRHGAKKIHFTMSEFLWFGRTFYRRQKGVEFMGKLKQIFRNDGIDEVCCDP